MRQHHPTTTAVVAVAVLLLVSTADADTATLVVEKMQKCVKRRMNIAEVSGEGAAAALFTCLMD